MRSTEPQIRTPVGVVEELDRFGLIRATSSSERWWSFLNARIAAWPGTRWRGFQRSAVPGD
jgi:hypothetical protein